MNPAGWRPSTAAHGGPLVNLMADGERGEELRRASTTLPSWDLTERQLCDLELLLNGAFSPLHGFMTRAEYDRVCHEMRLPQGVLWPIPVTLDVTEAVARTLGPGAILALRDAEGAVLAALHVAEVWRPDLTAEAQEVYGGTSPDHAGVAYLLHQTHPWYVGGRVEGIQPPRHYDFVHLRHSPARLRCRFSELGWQRVVAFQTRNPMHRAHQEMTFRAARELEANLLIHPVVGMTKPGDVDHFTRVRSYQALLKYYPGQTVMLSLLPLAMRMAGPREAVWHAIIRKNYGCTHFIVGRDHAGPGHDSQNRPFYDPYEAQDLVRRHEDELAVRMVPFQAMVYLADRDVFVPQDEVPEGADVKTLSGTQLREHLASGRAVPPWFSFPEVIHELRRTYPPRAKQGFTVLFTGLPSSGKSTVANVLAVKLQEIGGRPITLLDGDLVRKNLSSELGFSREHRDLNIRRIGFVASEITKNGGVALCAPIAPYDRVRRELRELITPKGGFVLVYLATPLAVCEARDRKGLYAKARAGLVQNFTGVSDPYEVPTDADVVLNAAEMTPEECAQSILLHLEREGYVGPNADNHVS